MNLLTAFIYETDRRKALAIIKSAQANVDRPIAAGGHQGFGPVGGLYSQASPLLENLYGSHQEQIDNSRPRARPIENFRQRTYAPMPSQTSFLYNGDQYRSWYLGGKRPTPQPSTNCI
ncbi:hypothetical protein Ciccas_010598 [Cichlidogyrus casuarinus]|uniref:Uncharacterized protein n=1 Tax=Cichlidogyrus casuarinus TaxID=1844966 RepID=A0ABD2PUV1_9PLAT